MSLDDRLGDYAYRPKERFKDGYAWLQWLAEQSHKRSVRRLNTPMPIYRPTASLVQRFRLLTSPYRLTDYPGPIAFLASVLGYNRTTVERVLKGDGDKRLSGVMARRASKWLRERAGLMLDLAGDFDRHADEQERKLTERLRGVGFRRYEAKLAKEGIPHPARIPYAMRPNRKKRQTKPSASSE